MQRDLENERKKTISLTSLLDTARTRADQLEKEKSDYEVATRNRKAAIHAGDQTAVSYY